METIVIKEDGKVDRTKLSGWNIYILSFSYSIMVKIGELKKIVEFRME